ncbi:MAG: pyridoxal-phosphate dependent enzyme [Alphaproteobacteria bacterium]|nr:pyridoxal-phosphate dependent enzyme [Alphaproteobacteria bacterium]
MSPSIYASQSDAMSLPQLIRVEENLVAAVFRLMKLLPAKYVVEQALADGRLNTRDGLVETSSGTYALGLGIVCAEHGVPFVIVSDPAIDDTLRRRLEDLGGEVRIVDTTHSAANVQVLRLQEVHRHLKAHPEAFWPCQYNNPENRDAYGGFARQLLGAVGDDLTLVGTVGSGGSTCGAAVPLRAVNPDIRLVGVDTFGSVLFGLPVGKRVLRGLGNSIHPGNLHHHHYDEIHWVGAADAFQYTRMLHRSKALFMGPTSGAAYQVARWIARQDRSHTVVFIAADEGYRYQDTIYDDAWLRAEGVYTDAPAQAPVDAPTLAEARLPWARFVWGRRTFTEVTGQPWEPV